MKMPHLAIIKGFFKLRNARMVMFSATVFAIGLYYLVFDFWAPNNNFIKLISRPSTVNFYSGAKGGFYVQIGEFLERKNTIKNHLVPQVFPAQHPFYKVQPTNGALENLNRVITGHSAVGLVNEITAPPQYYTRSQAKLITSLYMERLHIFYNKAAFRKAVWEKFPGANLMGVKPMLKEKPDDYTKAFLNKAKINGGPHGSGTRLLTRYFLDAIEDIETKQLLAYNNREGVKEFTNENYDIHFAVVGDPLIWINALVKDTSYAMLSIDPALINQVNNTYDLNLQFAFFSGKYLAGEIDSSGKADEVNNIITAGTYVNLVASRDVQTNQIIKLLEALKKAEPSDFPVDTTIITDACFLPGVMDDFNITDANFPLKEIAFENIGKSLEVEKTNLFQSSLIFLIFTSSATLILMWLYSSLVTQAKPSQYRKDITETCERYSTAKSFNTIEKEIGLLEFTKQDVQQRIDDLCIGFRKIFKIIDRAYSDHISGKISESNYKEIENQFHKVIDRFHGELYRQIYCAINQDARLNSEDLHGFFVAGFLKNNDYRELIKMLEGRKNIER